MKKWVLILTSIMLLILDNSMMPFLAIKGAFPSLLFIFAIAYSIIRGKNEALFIGVVSGILQDIFFYNGFGINSLTNMLLCVLAAIIGENIYKNKKLIPVIAAFILSLLKVASIFVIFKLINRNIDITMALYSSIYNVVVMFLGYNFVLKLCEKDKNNSSWRFK
ncbi:rod shape-determining protein MreD [Clostridium sp.]|uniref:rod shape-determining protein MreD n=1 Tax=Clostridium sp. TaxID=1506 RepID=UPI003F2A7F88